MSPRQAIQSTFTQERTYPASRDRVFAAWADPPVKASWFAPDALRYELDFCVGGQELLHASHEGGVLQVASTYHDIVNAERIVYTSSLAFDDRIATVSLTTVEFHDDGTGTRLILCEQGTFLDGLEQPDWREQGTSSWLDALGARVRAT